MPEATDYSFLWGNKMSRYPKERLLRLGHSEDTLPAGDKLPDEVRPIYTGSVEHCFPGIPRYSELVFDDLGPDVQLLVLGRAPIMPDWIYVMHLELGGIYILNIENHERMLVNSTLWAFVEFLSAMTQFFNANPRTETWAESAEILKAWMNMVDSRAFQEFPELSSWWVTILKRLQAPR